ncbi:quercetin dioxygenase-like cupin family protein [Dysgonomonas alginatilytica]|uniref:Quercetin dioxygenase-like cupin family protein n=1 Tax=Dysgonomonas alginatilytica TaxID=1605892 RepID=A0A2V3PIG4_9BACT|nr:cupin domain-containing protein [Dysgonomonas alginatilytica]PXV59397.1 quercetin dioxygenase-like cupin family protein [Dysgonomonas alginatilytica]
MKKISIVLLTSIVFVFASCCNNQKNNDGMETANNKETILIFPKGEVINNDYFSGKAWLKMLVTDKDNFDATVGNVIFEPGVRNNWHSHPGGQILLCTRGTGYYQEKGKPIQLLEKGDVIEILPDIVHWHGATPDSEFEHIAIGTQSSKGSVVWLEPVTDEEYNSYKK